VRHGYANAHIHSDGDCHSNCHIHSDSDCHIHANGDRDGNVYANSNGDRYSNCDRTIAALTDTTASADTADTPEQLLFR